MHAVRIPAKANADSGGNANGIPGRRRTVLGAKRRWHFDCAGGVRLRQGKPNRSAAQARCRKRRKGCGERGAALVPASALERPGERQLGGCEPLRFLRMESPRISMRWAL